MRRAWIVGWCTLALGCPSLQQAPPSGDGTSTAAPDPSSGGDGIEPTSGDGVPDPDGDSSGPPPPSEEDTGDDTSGGGDPMCMGAEDCADDSFCNGAERCMPDHPMANGRGCVPGNGDPCTAPDEDCNEQFDRCVGPCDGNPDQDGDQQDSLACGGTDCNDEDPDIYFGAEELCDGAGVDEDCTPRTNGDDLIGTDAHCTACNDPCAADFECYDGACSRTRRVFLTSSTFTGDLDGPLVADGLCIAHAVGASLGGLGWRAYLVDAENDLTRHTNDGGPFRRLDGVVVADDWTDLTDGSLQAPIDLTEEMDTVTGGVWTGLISAAVGADDIFCDSWTDGNTSCNGGAGMCGATGSSDATNVQWQSLDVVSCDENLRLYCIEQ
ncbi:MAG: hypothetical protein AAF721_07335 [Myxococcota bacterium]